MQLCKHCGKKFKPVHSKQEDCSEACLVNRFDLRVRRTRKLARIMAGTMGYRSMGEVRFAAILTHKQVKYDYEITTMSYQYKPQKYTIDFTVDNGILLEYKGKLDAATRKKMLAVKRCNPSLDIRFVFEKPNNYIYKGAKTRYWEWAEKNGFGWYDVRDVTKIKKDIANAGKKSKAVAKGIKTKP